MGSEKVRYRGGRGEHNFFKLCSEWSPVICLVHSDCWPVPNNKKKIGIVGSMLWRILIVDGVGKNERAGAILAAPSF